MIGPVPVVVTATADADVDGNRDWYRRELADRPDLLDRFESALLSSLDTIADNPEVIAADSTGTRHVRLKKVPDVAFFKLLSDPAAVFCVMHEKLDPWTWHSRV